jgi:hypothetical protein
MPSVNTIRPASYQPNYIVNYRNKSLEISLKKSENYQSERFQTKCFLLFHSLAISRTIYYIWIVFVRYSS